MQSETRAAIGPQFFTDGLARFQTELLKVAAGTPPSFSHSHHLLDRHGMVQFANGSEPDLSFGYCVDDNSRALLVAVLALCLNPKTPSAEAVGEAGLRFVEQAQLPSGLFHNFMNEAGQFEDDCGSQECFARTLWACGVAARSAPIESWRKQAHEIFRRAIPGIEHMVDIRPRAYVMLGLAALADPLRGSLVPASYDCDPELVQQSREILRAQAERLAYEFDLNAKPAWPWWEPELTWGNARPVEALLRAAAVLGEPKLHTTGLKALHFLASVTQPADMFVPIGNDGWYVRDQQRAIYDQQPIEACGMVDVWLAAKRLSGEEEQLRKAFEAFSWFLGHNTANLEVAVPHIGASHDGLKHGSLNPNMGAESTLSYVHAHCALAADSIAQKS